MLKLITGNLFNQDVECFVNPWNMNYIPWFILLPHGVSGELKKRGGYKPFNELLSKGIISPGKAVITSGGKLPQKIIHVSGLKWYWTTNILIVENCTRNALLLAQENNIKSIAFPLIGSGVGGLKEELVLSTMEKVINERDWSINITIVKFNNK